jgi:F0F1-type ATP synthase membrane subunit c/vacuolar-type H+-ATPase subunit K
MVAVSEKGVNQNQLTVTWIIWGAMFVTLGIYVLICHLVIDGIRQSIRLDFTLSMLRNILYGIGILTLFLAHFVRRFILTPGTGGSESMSSKPPPLKDQFQVIGKYTAAMILSLAFSESVAIFGLVLFFLGDSFQTLYIFTGISALGMFHYRPKREEIKNLVAATQTRGAIVPQH